MFRTRVNVKDIGPKQIYAKMSKNNFIEGFNLVCIAFSQMLFSTWIEREKKNNKKPQQKKIVNFPLQYYIAHLN